MKQAFKSILTINFTPNKNKVDYDTVKNYLQENSLLNGIGIFNKNSITAIKNLHFFRVRRFNRPLQENNRNHNT